MSTTPIKVYIPDELLDRLDEQLDHQSRQEFIMAAIRDKVYGSPVEVELRRQYAELLDRVLGLDRIPGQTPQPTPAALREVVEDNRKGW